MSRFQLILAWTIGCILIVWTLLTLWAQHAGKQMTETIGKSSAPHKALIVFNPDPIYNLDLRISRSLATALIDLDYVSTIATCKRLPDSSNFDLYIFCANTYNWAPDWPIQKAIERLEIKGKRTLAITLGSGSTQRAQRLLEERIKNAHAELIASRSLWLLRPNDENRMQERNVDVACELAADWITQEMSK